MIVIVNECVRIEPPEFDSLNNPAHPRKSEYRRQRDTGIWHWKPECRGWPTNDYFSKQLKPDWTLGRLCPECKKIDARATQEEKLVGV